MMRLNLSKIALLTASALFFSVNSVNAADYETTVQKIIDSYRPAYSEFGKTKVTNLKIDDAKKTVNIEVNEAVSYIPLTQTKVADLKNDIKASLDGKYADYDVDITVVVTKNGKTVSRHTLDELALFAPKKLITPSETRQFVTRLDAEPAPKGLDGSNIAMWQSHGWYFEPKLNRWEWQRARILQTVEDLYTQSYVMPFLMPMLENAGAYVMSPRERDTNLNEIIIDNDGGYAKGKYADSGWKGKVTPGFAYTDTIITVNVNPFRQGTATTTDATKPGQKAGKATWTADIPEAGNYAVYVSYQTLPNSATDATYTVNALDGKHSFKINQQMGGGTWIYLGHFPFAAGTPDMALVELSTESADDNAVITADAVKIGGGMGNVARKVGEPKEPIDYQYMLSGYPRFTEAAMYWLQWAGAPDSVYTISKNINDYTDDYRSRGEWVNWLAGGSSVLPDRKGLNIPVDISFAFHTDAGTTKNDSIIGTLGIYCTDGQKYGENFVNGMSRYASRDLTDLVLTNTVEMVRSKYEPNWTRRGMWNASYYEARVPEVPGMLLEFLSHQNFADMKYGLDPQFRFDVSRAIYKAFGQFIAHRDGREFIVQPLPVNTFAITGGNDGQYILTWKETVDSLESTASPDYYIVQERINDGAFKMIGKVEKPVYKLTVNDNEIHSYRIIAGNEGGVSFPGEILALCYKPQAEQVNIINGFTRISAPDWFEAGDIAGFNDAKDHGVPYMQDISYIGSMYEFRRNIPWTDDDSAGFGASRANYEDKVIAGNTFDFVYRHGQAIANAGYGFVSSSVQAYMEQPVNDNEPRIVDLILGKQKEIKRGRGAFGSEYKAFPNALQQKIRALTKNGGAIFVSGSYVATDIWDNPFSDEATSQADKDFATGVLGYHWRVGQASIEGKAYEVQTRFPEFTGGVYDFSTAPNGECYAAESPDSFYPSTDKGTTFMRYSENNLIAGIAHDADTYRTVVIGFPFETIYGNAQRDSLMKQVLNFLSLKKSSIEKIKDMEKSKKKKTDRKMRKINPVANKTKK